MSDRLQDLEAALGNAYAAAVAALAANEAGPSEEELIRILAHSGKSAHDLAADVATQRRVNELRAIVASKANLDEQHRRLTAERAVTLEAEIAEQRALQARIERNNAEHSHQSHLHRLELARIAAAARDLAELEARR